MIVSRPKLSWVETLYLPGVFKGVTITAGHFIDHLLGRKKVTMQYPEEKWPMPDGYRGAPTLVHDEEGREVNGRTFAHRILSFMNSPFLVFP